MCRPITCEYFTETDTLSVAFVTPMRGLIHDSDEAVPGLLVDYTNEQKIVNLDISCASTQTRGHFSDTDTAMSIVTPACVQAEYSQETDTLTVSFVNNPQHCSEQCTDDDRIVVWLSESGKWEGIVIAHAMESTARRLFCARL